MKRDRITQRLAKTRRVMMLKKHIPTDEPSGILPVISEAQAGETSEERTYRDHYYPGTEELAADEMRVLALGTGMPANAGLGLIFPESHVSRGLNQEGMRQEKLFKRGYFRIACKSSEFLGLGMEN
jgi:hypothetical protein